MKKDKDSKIFRGAYQYYKNDSVYSEETFDVYRDRKENSLNFDSVIHCRVATGELLSVSVDYTVNKDYVPQKVIIKRSLGSQESIETYKYDSKKNIITYIFNNKGTEDVLEIQTPPKFHITTPVASSSMLFMRAKKVDTTSKSLFSFISSHNQWTFNERPYFHTIAAQRVSLGAEKMAIGGHNVQATQFRIFAESEEKADEVVSKDIIRIWLSPYITIPYVIRTDDGNRVQVKYLNNLQKED